MGSSASDRRGGAVLRAAPQTDLRVRDMKLFGKAHTMELSEEDIEIHMPTLSEKLELLGRAIQDPELEVYSTRAAGWD